MRYSWPLLVIGVAAVAWSRLGGAPGLGIVGLVLIAIAVGLRLRRLQRARSDTAPRAGADTPSRGPDSE